MFRREQKKRFEVIITSEGHKFSVTVQCTKDKGIKRLKVEFV